MPTTTGFLGQVGTLDWVTDQRPKSWRQGILLLFPNGRAPLTGLMSAMKSESITDSEHSWWTQALPNQSGAVTNTFNDADLTGAYTEGTGAAGDIIYHQVAAAVAKEFRVGHQILTRDDSQLEDDFNCEVTSVVINGASSTIGCKLLEADGGSGHTIDRVYIVGSINSEGAAMPDVVSYQPTKQYNYTQIWRNALDTTGTALATTLRTGDHYRELKRQTLELHSIEMEKTAFWGVRTEGTGTNGKPKRTAEGCVSYLRRVLSGNEADYVTDTSTSANGKTWIAGGMDWLNEQLELLFRYADGDIVAFAGSAAVLGIQRLASTYGQLTLTSSQTGFGTNVTTWVTPFGSVDIITHPLWSYETSTQNSMFLMNPRSASFKALKGRDTFFRSDPNRNQRTKTGDFGLDGIKEEYLTEGTFEWTHGEQMMLLNGLNKDNTN